jgi:DNA-directed RNA polymerase specialized sigma subunit
MCINEYLKTKDLVTITGKSLRQCERDMKVIRSKNKKQKGQLIKINEVASYYGISETDVKTKLLNIKTS